MKGQGMFNAATNNDVLKAVMSVIEEFRKFDSSMEANQMLVFLLVATRPGIRLKEIEKITGMSNSAVSRNVLSLSKTAKGAPKPGHDLISAMADAFDSRAKAAATTARGRKLAEKITEHIQQVA